MTKEEIKKEAYGEYYDKHQQDIDENGWLSYGLFPEKFLRKQELLEFKGETQSKCFVRPKSLQGIETNKGWITVNPKDSGTTNPTETGFVHIVYRANGEVGMAHYNKMSYQDVDFFAYTYSHWQPIDKKEKPLY
jgi:hypothetical protein